MRTFSSTLALLLTCAVAFADSPQEPFRILTTPTGCAVLLEGVRDEYRINSLVGGGVVVSMVGIDLPALEKAMPGTCLARYRVTPSYGGTGSAVELRPAGVEFSGVIRSKNGLQVIFEKVVSLSGQAESSGSRGTYRIGVGDVLRITVYNHEDLTKEAVVADDGKIGYSLLGDIEVAGRTIREVQDGLTAALGKDFIVNPQVSLEVKTYGSQFVYVNGPVKSPGRYSLQSGPTLKDAISLAGGFGQEAGYGITVSRKPSDPEAQGEATETFRFKRQEVDFGLANLELQNGDVVTVSEKDYVYMSGELREPGKYELGSGLTLLRAIAVAKGLTDWADRKKIAVIRVIGGQTIRETINLKDVEKQKAPDIPLVAGDSILVPRRIL